ncbi:hypothetical protein [Streptomyces sp. NPDC093097]|uniref:hypothetical protein n=1 Tax=Streptomyces sp. NPDC093097 TaxID=3366027 RepID=UPI00380671C5
MLGSFLICQDCYLKGAPDPVTGLSQALYRLHIAHSRDHDPAEALAKLASTNAGRIKIPDTDDGRRLRDALRALRPQLDVPQADP